MVLARVLFKPSSVLFFSHLLAELLWLQLWPSVSGIRCQWLCNAAAGRRQTVCLAVSCCVFGADAICCCQAVHDPGCHATSVFEAECCGDKTNVKLPSELC